MLTLPEWGFRRSTRSHNVEKNVFCDWLEASVLFAGESVSQSDVVDTLIEESIYDDPDHAMEFVTDAWSAILTRQGWLGVSKVLTKGPKGSKHLAPVRRWDDAAAHSFCLAVSLRSMYSTWKTSFPAYQSQGVVFESIALEAFRALGWEALPTGWSAAIGSRDLVDLVANTIKEPITNIPIPTFAKDEGLDIVCFFPFQDARGGHPVFLVQCASGDDWIKKLGTPKVELWRQYIVFSSTVGSGIAIAQSVVDDDHFRRFRAMAGGPFWDRYRLLAAGRDDKDWLGNATSIKVREWLQPVIDNLPLAD